MGLSVKNLTFCYQEKTILKDLSLEVNSGALGMLLGANGAGKSTLIRCICGLLKPLQGKIYCNEIETTFLSAVKRAGFFGYVPQGNHVEPGLSVMETLLFQQGHPTNEMLEKAASILFSFGLGNFALRRTHCLSGGELQRVLIARALLQDPQVLILDEPVSNLDLKYQFETMELLHAICREKNTAILAALHDINMAAAYGDTVFLLHKGRVYATGAPCSAVSQENVSVVFDVAIDEIQLNGRKWIVPKLKNT